MAMALEITHDRTAHRFETTVDGSVCVIDYTLAGGVMTIHHTGVPGAVEGRGIASALMQAATDAARDEGWKIRPSCSYAAAWMKRHPQAADLLA
jgi:predicted GNAT family acetyltransferase